VVLQASVLTAAVAGLAVNAEAGASGSTPVSEDAELGARLYEHGVRVNGAPLLARRESGGQVEGGEAACTGCHRRSGLGTFEGAVRVPPLAWRLLVKSSEAIAADRSVPHVLGYHPQRPAYSLTSFARAVRQGIGADGHPLSWVMPRYDLDDADLAALRAHLATLAAAPPAGAESGQLRFALVLTPSAEPHAAEAAIAILERGFADHNAQIGALRGDSRSDRATYDVERVLKLDIWRLQGESSSWPLQLDGWLARARPFALVGGLGGGDWSVIDRFCEARHLPAILPSPEAPPGEAAGFYSIYFQRGVRLEAALIAAHMRAHAAPGTALVQIYRAGDSGELAAAALRLALGPGFRLRDLVLPAGATLPALGGDRDALAVLWLRAEDLASLATVPGSGAIYLSGIMSGEPVHLPSSWAARALIAYPWELPERRRVGMNFPLGWLHAKGLAEVNLRVQTDAWLAWQVLDVALADLIDAYYPEYLVERVESLLGHRLMNAHYPRLSLAPGQRFASKGAYLVRLRGDGALLPEGPWTIP
jgi:cytochrome c553